MLRKIPIVKEMKVDERILLKLRNDKVVFLSEQEKFQEIKEHQYDEAEEEQKRDESQEFDDEDSDYIPES